MNNENRIYLDILYTKDIINNENKDRYYYLNPEANMEEDDIKGVNLLPIAISIAINEKTYYFERNDVDYGEVISRHPDIVKSLIFFGEERNIINFVNDKSNIHYMKDSYENIIAKIQWYIRSYFMDKKYESINIISDCDIDILDVFNLNVLLDMQNTFTFKFITYDSVKFILSGMSPDKTFSNIIDDVEEDILKKDNDKVCLIHMTNIKNMFEHVFFKILK